MEPDYYRQMDAIQATHWWYQGRRRILRSLIAGLRLPPAARIIEIGSGSGANLNMLKEFGTVVGVEPYDFARAQSIRHSGCDVRHGTLPDDLPFDGPFDLVGVFDVIEHVAADAESARSLYRLTAPSGWCALTVPAWPFLWSQHDVANHHKRRYRRDEFRRLLEQAGFMVRFISYYNFFLFPAVAVIRLIKKTLKLHDSPDMRTPSNLTLNTMLCEIFAAERFLLKNMPLPFGVSIVALCQRPAR